LHLDQLEHVQQDVANLLEHGLNPPAPTNDNPDSKMQVSEAAPAEAGPAPLEPATAN